MRAGWIKRSLCLLCLVLPVVWTATAATESGTPSVLNRVQREEDPEVGELIRLAMANRKDISEKEALEIVRKVTRGYAQIKLLDQQIEQVARKVDETATPAEMRYELLLAKAELEAKRMTELADLREVMGILPVHAFGQQPISTLNAWVHLSLIDERVYVLENGKPFFGSWMQDRWKSVGLLSERETLDYLRGRLNEEDSLPIRIDVLYRAALSREAEDLRAKVALLVRQTNSQMKAEVRTELATWTSSGRSPWFVREGKITTFYPASVLRPAGGPNRLRTGLVPPNDIEQHILWRILFPGNVPLKFIIEYDEASTELAKQVAETARTVAKRLGISEFVGVVETLVEPVPETVFLGRWQVAGAVDVQTFEIQPGGACLLTMGKATDSNKAGEVVSCPWTLATKEIFIDSGRQAVYRGHVNPEGDLVIEKGTIWAPGSWHSANAAQTPATYKKVK